MFHLLKLTAKALLSPHKITDAASCQTFLKRLVAVVKLRAAESNIQLDAAFLKLVEFVLNDNALFGYIYRLISDQIQTSEILFESMDEEAIAELVGNAMANSADAPESVDIVLIVSLVTRFINLINTIKQK